MFFAPYLALLALSPSQDPAVPKPKADPFEATIKATKYGYKLDKEGDYTIEIQWDDEKRSQMIFIRGAVEKIVEPKATEVATREVWSVCWKGKERPSAEALEKLLTKHYKFGAFQLEKAESGTWSAYYRVDIPDNASSSYIRQAIRITAEAADNMEKELLGTDDF
ncbi:hypothetical protein [Armatimonas sp.]|uniref:hypothetical protein n=1 Tax=Armatimonas sp. TaxID=1872638 RepID=UPI00286AEC42|nr:hypothetical protein [Armatimonas sp.]